MTWKKDLIRVGTIRKMLNLYLSERTESLFNHSTEYRSQLMFRSTKHEVHTIKVNKVALNRDDDKQIIKKDGISTFAGGYQGQLLLI